MLQATGIMNHVCAVLSRRAMKASLMYDVCLGQHRPWHRCWGPLLARPVHPLREAHRPLGCPSAPAQARVRARPLAPGTALREKKAQGCTAVTLRAHAGGRHVVGNGSE